MVAFRKIAVAAVIAALLSTSVTPAMALPVPHQSKIESGFNINLLESANWRKNKRKREKVSGGDIVTGLAILGGAAAVAAVVASKKSKSKKKKQYQAYPLYYPDGTEYYLDGPEYYPDDPQYHLDGPEYHPNDPDYHPDIPDYIPDDSEFHPDNR